MTYDDLQAGDLILLKKRSVSKADYWRMNLITQREVSFSKHDGVLRVNLTWLRVGPSQSHTPEPLMLVPSTDVLVERLSIVASSGMGKFSRDLPISS